MVQDTDCAVTAWQDDYEEVVKTCVTQYRRKIAKLPGGGFLVKCPSVQDAVKCAIADPQDLTLGRPDLRIGANPGDIFENGFGVVETENSLARKNISGLDDRHRPTVRCVGRAGDNLLSPVVSKVLLR